MSPTIVTPCQSTCTPWATSVDVCSPCDDYSFPSGLLDNTLQAASDILFELSGRQFAGICQDTVRPCAHLGTGDTGRPVVSYRGPFQGGAYNYGAWGFGGGVCNMSSRAGCCSISEITLGAYPVTSIVSVKVDGVTLAASQYRIDDNRYLVRLANPDGTNPGWACSQDMTRASTEEGTWEVTFTYGVNPPKAGVTAAASLGCQLALACQPETVESCRLPQRVTQVTRQGVTAVMLDPFAFLDEGKVGIYEVDLFLKAYNPNGLRRRATVTSPDIGRSVRRVTTG